MSNGVPVIRHAVHLVVKGRYDGYALAVCADPDDAQLYADQWNLANAAVIRGEDDQAVVYGMVPFYPAGQLTGESPAPVAVSASGYVPDDPWAGLPVAASAAAAVEEQQRARGTARVTTPPHTLP